MMARADDRTAYALQVMPLVFYLAGELFCPYAGCNQHLAYWDIGVNKCTNIQCGRKFLVSDTPVMRDIKKVVDRGVGAWWTAKSVAFGNRLLI